MTSTTDRTTTADFDAIVIGAGFAGLYALHRLRDAGPVGARASRPATASAAPGTGTATRAPAATSRACDYSLLVLRGAAAGVGVDRALRRPAGDPRATSTTSPTGSTCAATSSSTRRVTAAAFDEDADRWTVATDDGERVTAQFVVMAAGCLSAAQAPDIRRLDDFEGEVYHTGRWPHEGVDFAGKRVGVIGTGSTGMQSIPVIAEQAGHLTVFQRTPNYTVPARNAPLDPDERRARSRPTTRESAEAARKSLRSASPLRAAERVGARGHRRGAAAASSRRAGTQGGFEPSSARSTTSSSTRQANDTAAEFIRAQDPRDRPRPGRSPSCSCPTTTRSAPSAPASTPTTTRRSTATTCTLVDVRDDADRGDHRRPASARADARLRARRHRLRHRLRRHDRRRCCSIDIRGRGGAEAAATSGPPARAPTSGSRVAGFPNLFIITGPQSPSVLSNMPLVYRAPRRLDRRLHRLPARTATTSSRRPAPPRTRGSPGTSTISSQTLLPGTDSWYMGANIPGKPRVCMLYLGGAPHTGPSARTWSANGYPGFDLHRTAAAAAAA